MLDEKVPRKSNATSSGSRQIPGGRLVGFALAWVLGEPGWVIAALEDLDSLPMFWDDMARYFGAKDLNN